MSRSRLWRSAYFYARRAVETKFLRGGIRYDDLSQEEKDDWDSAEWNEDGDIPDGVSAEELNKLLFNADTVDQVATLMAHGDKAAGGDRIGKPIIFAKNRLHAEFIKKRFDINYPEYAGHFARVITYTQSLIDDFSIKDKAPHIAISVDMLDTGIDIPEVVNLVFFKLVRAKSKLRCVVVVDPVASGNTRHVHRPVGSDRDAGQRGDRPGP
jgi:type I restriction enzyme R subunit